MNIALIVGCARSGTNILGELIATHPDVLYIFEAHEVWEMGGHGVNESHRLTAEHATEAVREKVRGWFEERGRSHHGLMVEKCPRNILRIPYIRSIFPEAKIIHIVRDGRDVACSMVPGIGGSDWSHLKPPSWKDLMTHYSGPVRAALAWKEIMEIGLDDLSRVPHLQIRYEDLVLEPEGTAERVLSYLGLRWHESVESFCKKIQNETEGSYQARHQEIWYRHDHSRRIGRWRDNLTPEEQMIIQRDTGPLLKQLGYPAEGDVSRGVRNRTISVYVQAENEAVQETVKDAAGTVCCISGMHRSGTSMVARLLNLCGLYLGEEEELINPSADNPEGFWENTHFLVMNDHILEALGGSWDLPPTPEEGWEHSTELIHLRGPAEELILKYKGQPFWGWKDPRNSLTLPFWKSLCSGIKTVICLRNPAEVARSLQRRGGTTDVFAYNLWYIYNRSIMDATTPDTRIITHYDSFFHDPEDELLRIFTFLGVEPEGLKSACHHVFYRLRHHSGSLDEVLKNPRIPERVKSLYLNMLEETGSGYREKVSGRSRSAGIATDRGEIYATEISPIDIKDEDILCAMNGGKSVAELQRINSLLWKLLLDSREGIERLESEVVELEKIVAEMRPVVKDFRHILPLLEDLIEQMKVEHLSPKGLSVIGEICFVLGMMDTAENFLQKALEIDPTDSDVLNNLGVISFQKGKLAQAELLLSHALKHKAQYEEAQKNLLIVRETIRLKGENVL